MENATYGTPIPVYIVSPINGIYNVSINNEIWFNVTVVDYFGIYYINDLDAGDYVISTSCAGNKQFNPTNTSESFTVFKANNTATVNVSNVTYGEDTIIEVTSEVDGMYTVDINGTIVKVPVNEGKGHAAVKLNAGKYNIKVSFNENYDTKYNNATFTV